MRIQSLLVGVIFGAMLLPAVGGSEVDESLIANDSLSEDVNAGAGRQVNAHGWSNMSNANAGGNQLTGGGNNSNAGDRDSNDLILLAHEGAQVASYALEVSVTANRVSVSGPGSSADSRSEFSAGSGVDGSFGVSAISINSGGSASQNVNVNVTSLVGMDTP